jgi:hypothetical protein
VSPGPSPEHLIVGAHAFDWFVTLLTGVVAGWWIVVDSVRLRRALGGDRGRGAVKDQIFGSIVGLVIGAIGIFGVVMHHL